MSTKERATVTLTSETLRAARQLIPNLNLSALFDQALEATVREAEHLKIAASYAEFPSDFDDEIDWAAQYGMGIAEQQVLLNARRPWRGED
jgi:Post-segregation antitoxin CcdA